MKAADGVQIAERYRDRHTLLKCWTEAGKHPKTEYNTFEFAQEIVRLIEELSRAEERVWVLREAQTVSYDDITAWLRAFLIQEDAFGEGIPDFWDELNMTERLATALSEAGFSRAALTAAPEQGKEAKS